MPHLRQPMELDAKPSFAWRLFRITLLVALVGGAFVLLYAITVVALTD